MRLWLVAALVAALVGLAQQVTYLSHTTDSSYLLSTRQLCPDSSHELEKFGEFNLTHYRRQPRFDHFRRQRTVEAGENETSHPPEVSSRRTALYDYSTLHPPEALQASISNLGDTRRLDRFLYRLTTGQPVTIVALGGSVTVGHGPENKAMAYLYRVFEWINTTFPHPEHQFLNRAIPAVSSSYVAPCVLRMIPAEAHLVLLEFTFNDAERTSSDDMEEPTRKGLERLLRKLLRMESRPAVLNLHYRPFNRYARFWEGGEDRAESIFKYYGVPSLSMRGSMHRLLRDQAWLIPKLWEDWDVHPTCVGSKFVADIVIGFLQDAAAFALQLFHGQQQLPHHDIVWDTLPAPLFENNTADLFEDCIVGEAFRDLVVVNKGWQWVDEGRKPGQHKWGYVSWEAEDVFTMRVPVADFLPQLRKDRSLLVALGVLMTYERAGWLEIACFHGCSCPRRRVNSLTNIRYSLTYWKGLSVTIDEGSENCELVVVNSRRTNSGDHKNKVTSMLISLELDSFVESWKMEDAK